MKVLLVGSTGVIGGAVADALRGAGHEVVGVSRSSTPAVDLDDPPSVKKLYAAIGPVDAMICAAGTAKFGPMAKSTDELFRVGIVNKLMGQVNLVRFGLDSVKGSFVLTGGLLAHKPWPNTTALAMVNAGLEGFTRAAALELPGRRITCVCPPLVRETAVKLGMGEQGAAAADVAQVYVRALEADSGSTLFVPGFEG
ncbi:MAG: short chain dehydrogenase [Alphaproteobacteria bacterium]|nr:short chain dehydrogenase [Alphaproteobacteria bacterium]